MLEGSDHGSMPPSRIPVDDAVKMFADHVFGKRGTKV